MTGLVPHIAKRFSSITKRRSNTTGIASVVFIFGIAAPLWLPHTVDIAHMFLLPTIVATVCAVAIFKNRKNIHGNLAPWLAIWVLCFTLGITRSAHVLATFTKAPTTVHISEKNVVTAWQEHRYGTYSFGTITTKIPSLPGKKLSIIVPVYPSFTGGTYITVTCDVTKNILKYAATGPWYECKKPTELSLAKDSPSWLYRIISLPVQSFRRAITKTIPEPAGSFTSGILLGVDDAIPQNIKNDFRSTGTAHIFALSGFNITLIASCLVGLLAYIALSTRNRFALTITMIGFFILATGAESSSVRAGIMGAVILLGRHTGRIARTRILLPLAASLMLLSNPLILRYDTGFQLSFLATIGIITLVPNLTERMRKIPNTFAFRDTLAATVAASIATAPILVLLGNAIGFKNILANVLIGPLIPIAMVSGFTGTLAGIILPPLAPYIGMIARIPAQTIIDTANVIAHW